MPSTPEIDARVREAEERKRRGEPMTFAGARSESQYRSMPREHAEDRLSSDLVDLETIFGQQCVALGGQLRAMLATLAQLQRARMRAFGPQDADLRDLDREMSENKLRDLAREHLSVGADGFLHNAPPPSGGSDGNISIRK